MNRDDTRGREEIASSNCDNNNILDLPVELSIFYLTESHSIRLTVADHSVIGPFSLQVRVGEYSQVSCQ